MAANDPLSIVNISQNCDQSQPPDAEGPKTPPPKLPDDPTCEELKARMDWIMQEIERRTREQLSGRPPGAVYKEGTFHKGKDVSGKSVWDGHDQPITDLKNGLNKLRNRYKNKRPDTKKPCDDPPDDPGLKKVSDVLAKSNPTAEDWERENKTTVEEWLKNNPNTVKVTAALTASYVVYRVLRFIPSLLPPLWPTIPENLAIP